MFAFVMPKKPFTLSWTQQLIKCIHEMCLNMLHPLMCPTGVIRTQHKHSCRRRYSDDVDIVTVIVDHMKESTLRHCLQWVKAHQDDDKPYKELDLWG
jgi:hypothetical protein